VSIKKDIDRLYENKNCLFNLRAHIINARSLVKIFLYFEMLCNFEINVYNRNVLIMSMEL
jgi:hypothetical protein